LRILRGLEHSRRPADGKLHLFFLQSNYIFFLSHAAGFRLPFTDAIGEQKIMDIVNSGSSKKIAGDSKVI
jgi:hypothetical protein